MFQQFNTYRLITLLIRNVYSMYCKKNTLIHGGTIFWSNTHHRVLIFIYYIPNTPVDIIGETVKPVVIYLFNRKIVLNFQYFLTKFPHMLWWPLKFIKVKYFCLYLLYRSEHDCIDTHKKSFYKLLYWRCDKPENNKKTVLREITKKWVQLLCV